MRYGLANDLGGRGHGGNVSESRSAKQFTPTKIPLTIRRLVENFAFLPHRAEAQTTVLSKVGWSRFRAVLMLGSS
jgi:hypothetical protein